MKLVRNGGEHSYGPMVNGIRHCTLCTLAEPCLVGQFRCSGVRGMFGRPVAVGMDNAAIVPPAGSATEFLPNLDNPPCAEDLTGRGIASEPRLEVRNDLANGSTSETRIDTDAPRPVKNRRGISPASPAQRMAVKSRACIVTGDDRQVDPAHLLSRSYCGVGQDDPRAVVPLRRDQHRLFDAGELDLLPYLEPHFRVELAYAVERVGLLATLRQVTGRRWTEDAA